MNLNAFISFQISIRITMADHYNGDKRRVQPTDTPCGSTQGSSHGPRPAHYDYSRTNEPTLQGATAHNRLFPRSYTVTGSPMPWIDRHLRTTMER